MGQTPRRCGQRGHGKGRTINHGGKPGNRICPCPSRGANTLGDLHPQATEASLLVMETRTGLTPTSILTPIKTTSNLNTPTCGSQHKSSLIFTPLFSPNTEATLLTSL